MRPLYDLASVFAAQIRVAEEEAGRCYEPVVALVTDNKDPQKLGRVKVKYPVLSDVDTSWWAPIIMLGAGKNRGWFFIPEKDDEVLVLFEHGDLNRPIVVGALWNGKDKPADKNPGGNPRRVIRSRQNSKITFDDAQMKLIIEDGTSKGKITFDSNANKIIIEALDGDVCFQSPAGDMTIVAKSIELKASTNLEIHAGDKMQFGTGASAKVDGGSGVTMSGAKVNINCGNSQMPAAPTASPQDIADPYEARGSEQQGGGAGPSQQGNNVETSSSSSSGSAPSGGPSQSTQSEAPEQESEQQAQQQQQEQAKKDDPDVHVIATDLKTPGGEPLGFHEVIVYKKGTKEKVAGPVMTDDKGHVSFVMDEEGEYDFEIVNEDVVSHTMPPDDHEVAFELHAQFLEGGVPLAGETVKISDPGFNGSVALDLAGNFEMPADSGEYELTIKGQTFKAHAVRLADLGGHAEFHLEPKAEKVTDFEKARANRYSPVTRGEA